MVPGISYGWRINLKTYETGRYVTGDAFPQRSDQFPSTRKIGSFTLPVQIVERREPSDGAPELVAIAAATRTLVPAHFAPQLTNELITGESNARPFGTPTGPDFLLVFKTLSLSS